jgi:hypothetical protein
MNMMAFAKICGLAGMLGVIASAASPAWATNIENATASLTCNSYALDVTATDLIIGESYSIQYRLYATQPTGLTQTVIGAIPFDATLNTFNNTVTKPLGPLFGSQAFSGSAALVQNGTVIDTVNIGLSPNSMECPATPPPPLAPPTINQSSFNGIAIPSGSFIWFNANFTASGVPKAGTKLFLTNSTIHFATDAGSYDLQVPNAQITFSDSATCASTTFDSLTNAWMTTVPVSGSDEILLAGLVVPVPANFGGQGHGKVTWKGSLSSNAPGVSVKWKYGAAVYSSFSTDYNALSVKPSHGGTCAGYPNGEHAGTPEGFNSTNGQAFKTFVTGGAKGGGGSNFTGSWSGTVSVNPVSVFPISPL